MDMPLVLKYATESGREMVKRVEWSALDAQLKKLRQRGLEASAFVEGFEDRPVGRVVRRSEGWPRWICESLPVPPDSEAFAAFVEELADDSAMQSEQDSWASISDRIAWLRDLVESYPVSDDLPEEAQTILTHAPDILNELESQLEELADGLEEVEEAIDYAIDLVEQDYDDFVAAALAETPLDPGSDPMRRLKQRMLRFSMDLVDESTYTELFAAWHGHPPEEDEWVPPRAATPFVDWLWHDATISGQDVPLIQLFADSHRRGLPTDEREILDLLLNDRPSIYQVIDVVDSGYRLHDVLAGEVVRVSDPEHLIGARANRVAIMRLVPGDRAGTFRVLSVPVDIPEALWTKLHELVRQWLEEWEAEAPGGLVVDFFRTRHARLMSNFAAQLFDE